MADYYSSYIMLIQCPRITKPLKRFEGKTAMRIIGTQICFMFIFNLFQK